MISFPSSSNFIFCSSPLWILPFFVAFWFPPQCLRSVNADLLAWNDLSLLCFTCLNATQFSSTSSMKSVFFCADFIDSIPLNCQLYFLNICGFIWHLPLKAFYNFQSLFTSITSPNPHTTVIMPFADIRKVRFNGIEYLAQRSDYGLQLFDSGVRHLVIETLQYGLTGPFFWYLLSLSIFEAAYFYNVHMLFSLYTSWSQAEYQIFQYFLQPCYSKCMQGPAASIPPESLLELQSGTPYS